MSYHYITVGGDCSPAAALRNLQLREFALPFDWIVSTVSMIEQCFRTKFDRFHRYVALDATKTRVIDPYGFQFLHDYPLSHMRDVEEHSIGEGVFGEEPGKCITDRWYDSYTIVFDKYQRRIERFQNSMNDTTKPIIVLCRYSTADVLRLQTLFATYYKRTDVYFVNSSTELFENDTILNIHTEKNNVWNDVHIWREGMDAILKKISCNGSGA